MSHKRSHHKKPEVVPLTPDVESVEDEVADDRGMPEPLYIIGIVFLVMVILGLVFYFGYFGVMT